MTEVELMAEETGFLDRGDGQQVAWRRVAGRAAADAQRFAGRT
jgi:hypothetical protein